MDHFFWRRPRLPGYLTQADVLKRIGNQITPRDDTFTIRAYGEAQDEAGQVTARAWCEAEVREIFEFLRVFHSACYVSHT